MPFSHLLAVFTDTPHMLDNRLPAPCRLMPASLQSSKIRSCILISFSLSLPIRQAERLPLIIPMPGFFYGPFKILKVRFLSAICHGYLLRCGHFEVSVSSTCE